MKITEEFAKRYPTLKQQIGEEIVLGIGNVLPKNCQELFFLDYDFEECEKGNEHMKTIKRMRIVNKFKQIFANHSYVVFETTNGFHLIGLTPTFRNDIKIAYAIWPEELIDLRHVAYYYIRRYSVLRLTEKNDEEVIKMKELHIEVSEPISMPHVEMLCLLRPDFRNAWDNAELSLLKRCYQGIKFDVYPVSYKANYGVRHGIRNPRIQQ